MDTRYQYNKQLRSDQNLQSDPILSLLTPFIKNFCPLYQNNFNNFVISVLLFLFAMFAFPSIMVIILISVNRNIGFLTTILNIIGILIFYAIILYCLYLLFASYFGPTLSQLQQYSGTTISGICSTPNST